MGHRTIICSYCCNQISIDHPDKSQEVTCSVCNRTTVVDALSADVIELSFYGLNQPFSFVSIIKETESLKKQYIVLEPVLSKEDTEVLEFLKETLVKSLNVRLDTLQDDASSFLTKAVNDILKTYEITLDFVTYQKILYFLKQRFLQYGKIDPLMNDANIEDISCDGANTPLFIYQRDFGSLETNIVFSDDEKLAKFVVKLAQKCGKHISVSDPMLDATMPDGSRIQMTLKGEVTTRGSTFTIRKFRSDPITPVDLVEYKTFSLEMIAYLWMAVEHGFNALISGGTASGKTSALNALALFIPKESKIVSIEETREINLPHPNWIPGVTRSGFGEVINDRVVGEIDLFDLMKAALRQRPEYILVGEIRGKEAYVLFQAMATGHTTYSTVHADTTQALIHRLEGKPINIPRTMLQSLDIICLMRTQKTQDQQQRRCVKIVELLSVDSETSEVLTNTVFKWNFKEQVFEYSGKSYVLEQIHTLLDMTVEEMASEIKNRSKILQWLQTYHIREFTDVARLLATYAETPGDVLHLIQNPPEKAEKELKESLFSEEIPIKSILDLPRDQYDSLYSEKESKKTRFVFPKSVLRKEKSIQPKNIESKKKDVTDSQKKQKKKTKTRLSNRSKETGNSVDKKDKSLSLFSNGKKNSPLYKKDSFWFKVTDGGEVNGNKLEEIENFFNESFETEKQPSSINSLGESKSKPKKTAKKTFYIPKVRIKFNKDKLKNNRKKRSNGEK